MHLLAVNVGSSSLKLSVLDGERTVAAEDLSSPGGRLDDRAVAEVAERHGPFDAVGHRVVHGGAAFTSSVVIDAEVRRQLQALVDLAPLHLPRSLAGIDLVARLLPGSVAVACFDTAFHADLPPAAATYALPEEWRRRWGLRRFGFHGLSHAWASRRVAELSGRPVGELRTVTCHLGSGASLAAVAGGVSVDTTMGFTPLEGLVMATRSGSVDPGLLLWLEEHLGLPPAELASGLEHRSGMYGLTGTGDLAAILEAEGRGDGRAVLAVAVYLHRLRREIAAMAAATGGADAIAFTGGVGEHAPSIRARALGGLGFLGAEVEAAANETGVGDRSISPPGARLQAYVVEAREDLEIAREVAALLG